MSEWLDIFTEDKLQVDSLKRLVDAEYKDERVIDLLVRLAEGRSTPEPENLPERPDIEEPLLVDTMANGGGIEDQKDATRRISTMEEELKSKEPLLAETTPMEEGSNDDKPLSAEAASMEEGSKSGEPLLDETRCTGEGLLHEGQASKKTEASMRTEGGSEK